MKPFVLSLVVFMSVAISGCTNHADAPDPLIIVPSLSGTATRGFCADCFLVKKQENSL